MSYEDHDFDAKKRVLPFGIVYFSTIPWNGGRGAELRKHILLAFGWKIEWQTVPR